MGNDRHLRKKSLGKHHAATNARGVDSPKLHNQRGGLRYTVNAKLNNQWTDVAHRNDPDPEILVSEIVERVRRGTTRGVEELTEIPVLIPEATMRQATVRVAPTSHPTSVLWLDDSAISEDIGRMTDESTPKRPTPRTDALRARLESRWSERPQKSEQPIDVLELAYDLSEQQLRRR